MAIRYMNLLGSEEQIQVVKSIIEKFSRIKADILDHKIIIPNSTPEDNRKFIYYELKLTAPLSDLEAYLKALENQNHTFSFN